METVDFVPFPKPIKACKSVLNGLSFFDLRPLEQLNVSKINAYKYVCTSVILLGQNAARTFCPDSTLPVRTF